MYSKGSPFTVCIGQNKLATHACDIQIIVSNQTTLKSGDDPTESKFTPARVPED